MEIIVHEIAKDGLPDMDKLTGRVAFIFDGCIVSGWPLNDGERWEADSDVGRHGTFDGVTHWIEFPVPAWELHATQPEARGVEGMADSECPNCGAPCKRTVHERSGDWGWGTSDEQRATYRYAAAPEPVRVDDAIRAVSEAELFEDGLSGDLLAAGVNTIADAYMRGRLDACDELTAALAGKDGA